MTETITIEYTDEIEVDTTGQEEPKIILLPTGQRGPTGSITPELEALRDATLEARDRAVLAETNAGQSQNAAASSEAAAAASAAAAETSKQNADASAQSAATSEANAAASATAAAGSATSAANSATNAATSEQDAADHASAASASKDAAAASEQNAAASAAAAATSETNAANSAAAAATSEQNAATSETNAAASAQAAEQSSQVAQDASDDAANSAAAAASSETNAAASEAAAATSAANALASEQAAETHRTAAETAAANAAASETNAANSAAAAAGSKNDAQTLLDQFQEVFLGLQSSDPTVDLNGDPIDGGEIYVNSVSKKLRYYDGTAWNDTSFTDTEVDAKIQTAIDNLLDGAPSALDTLNELAAALGDNPNFAATIMDELDGKADLGHQHPWSDITGRPTTVSGYGITDAYTKTEVDTALAQKADKATTLAGYNIGDAYTKQQVDDALNLKADQSAVTQAIGDLESQVATDLAGKADLAGANFTGLVRFNAGWQKSPSATPISPNSDFNELTITGLWSISGDWINGPLGTGAITYTATVEVHERNWTTGARFTQIVNTSGASVGRYIRVGSGADGSVVWSAWKRIAITDDIDAAVAGLLGGTPEGGLDTITKLAAALGGDPNFAATIADALAGKLGIADQATDSALLNGQNAAFYRNASNLNAGTVPNARISNSLTPDKAFRRGNILGTVSQSGGTPTGALIEKGSNSNGRYIRFADGTMICQRTVTPDWDYQSFQSWSTPALFADYPTQFLSMRGHIGGGPGNAALAVINGAANSPMTDLFRFAFQGGTSSAAGGDITITAIGRWF